MTSLTHIILNHNFLQYKVPTQLARLTKLRDLFLEKNAFSGAVPTELAKLTALGKDYFSRSKMLEIHHRNQKVGLTKCNAKFFLQRNYV